MTCLNNNESKGPNVSTISLRFRMTVESIKPTPKISNKVVKPTPNLDYKVVIDIDKEKEKEYVPPIPFLQRAVKTKKIYEGDKDKERLDIFQKVVINIPLLDVIKKIIKYSKFLKDLCTHKRRLKGNERVNMRRNVSSLIQPKIVPENFATE